MDPEIHNFNAPNPSKIFKRDKGTHRLTYYSWGTREADNIVFCVHGMTRNARDFDFLADALVKDGYFVIALDVAGRGRSEHLKNPSSYGYPLYCADVIALFNELNLNNVHFIGTSMGGLIGTMLAAGDSQLKPEKKLIKTLILNDIGSFIPKESLMRIGEYIGKKMQFDHWQDAQDFYKNIMQPFGVRDESHWQHLLKHAFVKDEDDKYNFAYDRHIGDAFWRKGKQIKLPDMDFTALWKTISVPTFVIRGEKSDLLLKKTADEMAHFQNVKRVVEFPDIGHAPMLMEDEQINVVKEFLEFA